MGAPIPVAVLWIGLAALDGEPHYLGAALVGASPAVAARLLGLSMLGAGAVGASLAASGMITVVAAWGVLELIAFDMTTTLWADAPGGVRGEIAVATSSARWVAGPSS